MSVRKRKNTPYYWYDFTIKGNRFRGSTQETNQELAKEVEATERLKAKNELQHNKKPEITMDEACGTYLDQHLKFTKSWKTTLPVLSRFVDHFGAKTYFSNIKPRDVSSFVAQWREKVSDSSVNRYIDSLVAINGRLKLMGYVYSEIRFSQFKLPVEKERVRYLSEPEIKSLVTAAPDYLKLPIIFAIHTGLRKSNIVNLVWREVNLDDRIITVLVKSKIKKGRKHSVNMTEEVYEMLIRLKAFSKAIHVFTRDGYRPLGDFKKAWKTSLTKAKIEDFRFHDLRHTHASFIVMKTGNLVAAQKSLGHSNVRTTMKYAHLSDDGLKDVLKNTFKSHFGHIKGNEKKTKTEQS